MQRTDASLPGSPSGRPSLFSSFIPPVPPLPGDAQSTPALSPLADVFTTPQPPPQSEKPLPPIHAGPMDRASNDSEVSSLVVVDPISRMKGRTPSPDERPLTGDGKLPGHAKRRSMSVSDLDIFKFCVESPPAPTLPPKDHGEPEGPAWESSASLNGILSDFKGVLSTLDPDTGSSLLDLRDPSKPGRRAASSPVIASTGQALGLSQSDVKSPIFPPVRPATPIVTVPAESSLRPGTDPTSPSQDSLIAEPILPPRKSSLRTPVRSRSGSGPHQQQQQQQQAMGVGGLGSPRGAQLKYGPSPLRYKGYGNQMQSSYRDISKLRVHHHSIASTSEPSLIPINDEARPCTSCDAVSYS